MNQTMSLSAAVALLSERIDALLSSRNAPVIVALDGRCAAGKSTLAKALAAHAGTDRRVVVFHMDDYFLRPEQRTAERFATPGENVDHERFHEEILLPLLNSQPVVYRPYDCRTQSLCEPIHAPQADVVLIEGSYCCHSALWDAYALRVFLDVDPQLQVRRILARNGQKMLDRFVGEWIPMEESYHASLGLRERSDLVIALEE